MKRILSLLLCIILLLCCWGCQEEPPNNDDPNTPPQSNVEVLVTEDGLKSAKGQRIDNIYLEDNTIRYTFVNETDRELSAGPYTITVEKWEGDKWVYYPLLSGGSQEIAAILRAQSNRTVKHSISPQAVTPGKYRLVEGYEIFGTNIDGSVRVTRSDEYLYWIGEFSITEEQAATYPDLPEDIYYGAGNYQSKNVLLSISNVENEFHHAEFSLQNNGSKNLIIPGEQPNSFHIYQSDHLRRWDEAQSYWDHVTWSQPFPEGDTLLPPGESYAFPLCSDDTPTAKKRYDLEDGYYLYSLTCYWEGDTENVFSAMVFFHVQNNVIS